MEEKKAKRKYTKKTEQQKAVAVRPIGRPSNYRPEYAKEAYKLCLLGITDKAMADFFNVSEQTLNSWKEKHPDFLESLKEGKESADAAIAKSLYHRALGYSHVDTNIQMYRGQIIKTEVIKHYPPDTGAAMAWLKNRQPAYWRDRKEVEHSGHMTTTDVPLTDAQKAMLDTLIEKDV